MKAWFPRVQHYPGLCDVWKNVCARCELWTHNWQWLACSNRWESFFTAIPTMFQVAFRAAEGQCQVDKRRLSRHAGTHSVGQAAARASSRPSLLQHAFYWWRPALVPWQWWKDGRPNTVSGKCFKLDPQVGALLYGAQQKLIVGVRNVVSFLDMKVLPSISSVGLSPFNCVDTDWKPPYDNEQSRSSRQLCALCTIYIVIKSRVSLYAYFWVILRRLNFICQRFGALCYVFIGG